MSRSTDIRPLFDYAIRPINDLRYDHVALWKFAYHHHHQYYYYYYY